MTSISGDVIAKRLQMIKELVPTLSKVAILVRESSPDTAQYVRESQTAAQKLGLELQIEIERNPTDLEGIFVAVRSANALVVADDAEFTAQRDEIESWRSGTGCRACPGSGSWRRLAASWLMERVSAISIGVRQAMYPRFYRAPRLPIFRLSNQ